MGKLEIKDRNERGVRVHEKVETDPKLVVQLDGLRSFVDNVASRPAIALRHGGTYRAIDQTQVQCIVWDGYRIGYQVKELKPGIFTRRIFMETTDKTKISEIAEKERGKVLAGVLAAMIDQGQGLPSMEISADGMVIMITQEFMPLFIARVNDVENGLII